MSQTEEQKRWEPKVVYNIYTFVQLATLINSTDGNYTSRELLCLLYPQSHCFMSPRMNNTASQYSPQWQNTPEKGSNEKLYLQFHSFTSALERRLKGCRCDLNGIFFHLSRSKYI